MKHNLIIGIIGSIVVFILTAIISLVFSLNPLMVAGIIILILGVVGLLLGEML